jgi:hypothetical protein
MLLTTTPVPLKKQSQSPVLALDGVVGTAVKTLKHPLLHLYQAHHILFHSFQLHQTRLYTIASSIPPGKHSHGFSIPYPSAPGSGLDPGRQVQAKDNKCDTHHQHKSNSRSRNKHPTSRKTHTNNLHKPHETPMLSHPATPTSFPTPGTNARRLNPSPVRVVNPQDLSQSNLPAVEFLATIGREFKIKIGSELGCRDTTESYY